MGLLTSVLTLPAAPARFGLWVMQQVVDEAEREYRDPTPIRRQLVELEGELERGEISEEEFDRREDELLDRLDAISGNGGALR
ncbi:gas vesicle protein GvpG [Phaeacidiphilus oryzae]|jgi:cytochrome c-type biogenesis protein CcmH/NrfG|uniref:gas vesicle protein GvpG n=1 Tax=Phaeacidiphilus oryzae TaxID=348818 RepID=UPI00056153C0|nr:gas vesicle protein GvpG [Phaeacidiphilus oryzae]